MTPPAEMNTSPQSWTEFMDSMTNNFSVPTIVLRHRRTKPPPCFALAQHPPLFHSPGAPPLHPHPLTSSPFLCCSFIHYFPLYCEMQRGREGWWGDKGKERGLLLTFRWLHMKSQGTHLGCRRRRPASHLLPLGLPQLAFGRPCTAQACTANDRHICEHILLEKHQCVRWVDCMGTLFSVHPE